MKIVPQNYFGIVERFSVFVAPGFNASLGLHTFFENPEANLIKNQAYKQ